MKKTATMLCIALIDMGKVQMAQLVVPGTEQTVSVPYEKAAGETPEFTPGKKYVISFTEAPEVAAPVEEEKAEMSAEK